MPDIKHPAPKGGTALPMPGAIPASAPATPVPAPRRAFDPAFLGHGGGRGPKGPKGRPIPLPGKSRGR